MPECPGTSGLGFRGTRCPTIRSLGLNLKQHNLNGIWDLNLLIFGYLDPQHLSCRVCCSKARRGSNQGRGSGLPVDDLIFSESCVYWDGATCPATEPPYKPFRQEW